MEKIILKSLIDELNKDTLRGEDHEKPLTKIKIDEELINVLKKKNYNLTYIIKKEKKYY